MCVITGVLVAVGISGRFDSPEKSVSVGCGGARVGSRVGWIWVGASVGICGAFCWAIIPGRLQARRTIKTRTNKNRKGLRILLGMLTPYFISTTIIRFLILVFKGKRVIMSFQSKIHFRILGAMP